MRAFVLALVALCVATPAAAQINNPTSTDTSTLATKAEMSALQATVPVPASAVPPGVADTGVIGTQTGVYALANHTHASKARKVIVTTAADGTYSWTFATPFGTGVVPVCLAVAEVAAGVTDVINVQLVGSPTATTASFLVNRTQRSVVSLIGLTVLSVPASPGATKIHATCLEP